MPVATRHKVALGCLLLFSLGTKLAVNGPARPASDWARQDVARAEVTAFLVGAGLHPDQDEGSGSMIVASDGDCTARVALLSPEGWQDDSLRRLKGPDERLHFVYRNQVYARQPSWTTWFDVHFYRVLGYLHFWRSSPLVFGVIETAGCLPRSIPWAGLSPDT